MTIADEQENPRAPKKLSKSLDSIAALRAAMEKRLADERRAEVVSIELPKSEKPAPEATITESAKPAPEPAQEPPKTEATQPKKAPQPEMLRETLYDPAIWPRILFRIADRVQKLAQDYTERVKPEEIDPPVLDAAAPALNAFAELTNRILKSPERFADAQLALWQGYVRIWQNAFEKMQGKPANPIMKPAPTDKRFADQDWQNLWLFDFLKQSYLLTSDWARKLVHKETANLDPHQAAKIEFYARQMLDALSPSNFWMTNPEVLRTTLATGGDNLIKGFENLLSDLEQGHGQLRISMTDFSAFAVGKNIATTAGDVVFQNDLMQLIQYAPQTATVKKTPLLIIPPWINKYYILDLREKNSLINHLVQQGHTVFCISWVNPGSRHALVNFDDYMSDGAIAAMREIRRLTGEDNINLAGYCVGGTLLASTLAYLAAAPKQTDLPHVASSTFLTTLVDFSEPGDIGVFIDEEQIKALELRMAKKGYLDASVMATSFNLLRANDLIWSFVVNNYLLGREPFPFDILYWNADSTNLPAVMQSYYLRKMYLANKLVEPNGLAMKGVPIDLRRITTPCFLLGTQDDHIAPWKSTYIATQFYNSPMTFVLAGSGHIAGVVNPPASNKYYYWTNNTLPADADAWLAAAQKQNGSWWPKWVKWLNDFAGSEVPARKASASIEPAPGSYVKVRAA